ncbi:primosomal protein N' [Idiomarina sp. M1R2S28]|uniref:Replication restart protein PriA n=1 Tax=Idiomarina rhizosphaerae TaxID=2961572 RepID=A0A9X2JRK9_9GAMM|nr:primosomal protein N' [Idiomarina rhizosphaerae]MCP1338953.1 primosomal protein N' [Idiomarina rhizosphaerae]
MKQASTGSERRYKVALPLPLRQTYDYLCKSAEPLSQGVRVRVPFGQRQLVGYVVAEANDEPPTFELKAVASVLDEQRLWPDDIWQLVRWSSDYYHHSLGDVAANSLPVLLRKGDAPEYLTETFYALTDLGVAQSINDLKGAARQQQVLAALKHQPLRRSDLTDIGVTSAVLRTLQDKGWIEVREQAPAKPQSWQQKSSVLREQGHALNTEQAVAVSTINQQQKHSTLLLEGVTGSGKTEVYLQAMQPVLERSEQVLVLVPEIGLTPQTLQRFKERFDAPVVMLHSGMSDRERLNTWLDAKHGHAAIIIGTRSAVFTPCQKLGLIVVDEEHDLSYKQQDGFRYHARDIAIKRASLLNIPLVLGSATASLETLNNAVSKRFHWLKLGQRAGGAQMVKHELIDLKQQPIKAGVSKALQEQIQAEIERGNQVLLFLNRRGFAPALMCHECGWLAQCHRCDAYYTVHKAHHQLQCHHCGSQQRIPKQCGSCGSTHLISHGVGTEQLEHSLKEMFPGRGVLRIDRDSTRRKGQLDDYLQKATNNEYPLLVGTQMLAKGHHFPHVTLVALLDVDGALYSADFRAAERLGQLYTQVAGRAGREHKAGKVVLQTHHPEHDLIQDLLNNGYSHFALTALAERQQSELPPFSYLALFRGEATDRDSVVQAMTQIQQLMPQVEGAFLLGPMPALMERKAGRYRYQLLLHCQSRKLRFQLIEHLLPQINALPLLKKVRWSLDIDPQDFS